MRHKLCRSFPPWCPGVKNRCLFAMWYYGCWSSLEDLFTLTHCPEALDSLSVMDNELYIYTQLKHCAFLYRTGCFLSISIQYDITELRGSLIEAERPNSDLKSLTLTLIHNSKLNTISTYCDIYITDCGQNSFNALHRNVVEIRTTYSMRITKVGMFH